jgi:hypothetical protein
MLFLDAIAALARGEAIRRRHWANPEAHLYAKWGSPYNPHRNDYAQFVPMEVSACDWEIYDGPWLLRDGPILSGGPNVPVVRHVAWPPKWLKWPSAATATR